MKVQLRTAGDVAILEPRGKLRMGGDAVTLRGAITDAVVEGRKHILLDLSAVTSVDSAGLSELVAAYTTITNRGGELKLLRPSAPVSDVFQITQLGHVFEIFDDEEEALSSFVAATTPA